MMVLPDSGWGEAAAPSAPLADMPMTSEVHQLTR